MPVPFLQNEGNAKISIDVLKYYGQGFNLQWNPMVLIFVVHRTKNIKKRNMSSTQTMW